MKEPTYLKGADRPDTLRGVSLKYLVMDELALMEEVLELVEFGRDDHGELLVLNVKGSVKGTVKGTIGGREWQFVEESE